MALYYVHTETDDDGDHEVHTADCHGLPKPSHRKFLGSFTDCEDAVKEAKKHYKKVNGCQHCSEKCHTT